VRIKLEREPRSVRGEPDTNATRGSAPLFAPDELPLVMSAPPRHVSHAFALITADSHAYHCVELRACPSGLSPGAIRPDTEHSKPCEDIGRFGKRVAVAAAKAVNN